MHKSCQLLAKFSETELLGIDFLMDKQLLKAKERQSYMVKSAAVVIAIVALADILLKLRNPNVIFDFWDIFLFTAAAGLVAIAILIFVAAKN